MRPQIPWLTRTDILVLEFLGGHDLDEFVQSPSMITANIGGSARHVRRRIRVLSNAGLVERVDEKKGHYMLSDIGKRWLSNDLTTDEENQLEVFDPDQD